MQTNSITLIEIVERAASFAIIEMLAKKLCVNYYDLFNFDCEDGREPLKQNLLDYLTNELTPFDETLLQHIIHYSGLVKDLYTSEE